MGGNFIKSTFKRFYIPAKKTVRWFCRLKKPFKIATVGFFAFIAFDLFLCWYFLTFGSTTPVKLECVSAKAAYELYALDSSSHKGWINEEGTAAFKFSGEGRGLFAENLEKDGSVALVIRVKVLPNAKQKQAMEASEAFPVMFGLLWDDDFTAKGKYISKKDDSRLVVSGNLNGLSEVFDVSIALSKDELAGGRIPSGFFITSSARLRIVAACVSSAVLGFDGSTSIPFYGFAYTGGKIDFSDFRYDFSAAASVYSSGGRAGRLVPAPAFKFCFNDNPAGKSRLGENVYVGVNVNGERIFLNNVPSADEVILPVAAFNSPFGPVAVVQNGVCLTALTMQMQPGVYEKQEAVQKLYKSSHLSQLQAGEGYDGAVGRGREVLVPVKTDPGVILYYPQESWRTADYEIYEWDRYDRILFFDTRDLEVQSRFFTRLAFFVEKEGYKGMLLTDEQLKGKHGYNAHDYSAESMARFFNTAAQENFRLNYEEELLKRILIVNGLFELDGDFVVAKDGGIVSVSRETPIGTRTNLLAHEGWHTIFFRDEEFRNYVAAIYGTIDYDSRQFLLDYFKSQPGLGYDISDEYLMHNEFMAYIMQQPLQDVSKYFVHLAERGSVRAATPYLCDYIRFNNAVAFEDAATMLNDFVFDRYGIVCGNISLMRWARSVE